jgi:Glycosyl hydrolases family 16
VASTTAFADLIERRYALEFEDQFDQGVLDRSRWLPHHLPQWSSRARSAARYELSDGHLHLVIESDQEPWSPELDGPTRVSSIQTGLFAGQAGTTYGQHRFHGDALVREAQPTTRLYTPWWGAFELRARASDDPRCMVALWMIGFEDRPDRSAEICICEIFGRDVDADSALIGMGVHPFGDPTITDDFERVRLPIDVRDFHEYAAEWTTDRVRFFVDGHEVRTVEQSPGYEMQFMLGIYEFGERTESSGPYPKRFTIDRFRAYRPER